MFNFVKVPDTEKTKKFYDELISGDVKRSMWGTSTRFDAITMSQKPSVQRYFVRNIQKHIQKTDKVLEIGSGSGVFLSAAAPHCQHITGVDISAGFVELCNDNIGKMGLDNATSIQVDGKALPFDDASFDVVYLVDVIHHMEDISTSMQDALRVLKPGGKLLVFEPNKWNPLLTLMCVLDRNEWGLLRLGRKSIYRRMLEKWVRFDEVAYNGLLIGPQSKLFLWIADFLSVGMARHVLGWLSPKIFIAGTKK